MTFISLRTLIMMDACREQSSCDRSPVVFSSKPELRHGAASWELVSLGPKVGLWKGRLIPSGGVYDHASSATQASFVNIVGCFGCPTLTLNNA